MATANRPSRCTSAVRSGEEDPSCLKAWDGEVCGGILKSAIISFGQSLVPEDLFRAETAAAECDLLLAVGTTLGRLPRRRAGADRRAARRRGGHRERRTDRHGPLADVLVFGSISDCLPALVEGLPPVG